MYFKDIRELTQQLRVGTLIEHINIIINKNNIDYINNIFNEYIFRLNELVVKMNKYINIYKNIKNNNNEEKDLVISLYVVMSEIGDTTHELSLKLADELNNNNNVDYSIKRMIKGLIQCLERIFIRTRYHTIIEIVK